MFFCQKLLFAVYYSSSMNQCIKKSYSEHAAVIYGNAMYQSKKYLQRSVLLTAYCLPRMEVSHTMLAIFLAPLYILINIYIVRWMILWMGACTHKGTAAARNIIYNPAANPFFPFRILK